MALNQKGAGYSDRAYIKDQHHLNALDDLASQVQAVVTQGNFSKLGTPEPPPAPTAVAVTYVNGLYTVSITHANAPKGTRYLLQYSSGAQFPNPITVDLGEALTFQSYLPQQRLYTRVATKFLASKQSAFTYFGSPTAPQGVS